MQAIGSLERNVKYVGRNFLEIQAVDFVGYAIALYLGKVTCKTRFTPGTKWPKHEVGAIIPIGIVSFYAPIVTSQCRMSIPLIISTINTVNTRHYVASNI